MNFEFSAPGRIVFGPGVFTQAAKLVFGLGRRPLLVAGQRRKLAERLVTELVADGCVVPEFTVREEPDTESISAGLDLARSADCDCVIAIGGGSVLDTGKAIAALLHQPGELFDYLEVIGKAKPLSAPKAPLLAVPTTAGTGAEATCNAVILSQAYRVKVSLRHPGLFPTIALIDPELTYSLPPAETAATGLDALTQLIEPFVSPAANPFTDALCRDGIARAGRSLLAAFRDGRNAAARLDMSHGRLCAALLPAVMAGNIALLRRRKENSAALARYKETARLLTSAPEARAEDGVAWVADLCRQLSIEGLSGLGLRQVDVPALVEKARQASSMKGNPVELGAKEIEAIIEHAW
jgi:alcohol dehydrogenase class IV